MPVAIHTKYIPATDTRGSRIKATAYIRNDTKLSVTIPFDHSDSEHEQAAIALRDKYWPGQPLSYAGNTLDGRGDVYTIAYRPVASTKNNYESARGVANDEQTRIYGGTSDPWAEAMGD